MHVCLYEPVGNVVGALLSVVETRQACLNSQPPSETTSEFSDFLLVYQRFHRHFKLEFPRCCFVLLFYISSQVVKVSTG